MALDYGHTCPDIDRGITAFKSDIESYLSNMLDDCCPMLEGKQKEDFNHADFWEWCRKKTKEGHQVFVSEYNAPNDFKCVWEKQAKSSLSANGKIGGNKVSTEKLFVYCG